MNWLRSLFKKKTHNKDGFQLVVKDHWYTGRWYMWICKHGDLEYGDSLSGDKANKVSPADDELAFNWRRCGINSDDTSNLIDGLIPAMRVGAKIGLYKLTNKPKRRTSLTSDLAGWDDGMYVNLKFVKSITPQEGK